MSPVSLNPGTAVRTRASALHGQDKEQCSLGMELAGTIIDSNASDFETIHNAAVFPHK